MTTTRATTEVRDAETEYGDAMTYSSTLLAVPHEITASLLLIFDDWNVKHMRRLTRTAGRSDS